MSHDFPNVALPGDKADGYPAAGAASQLGKVWEVLPNPKISRFCLRGVGNGEYGSDFRDTTLHSTHWTIQQEGPRNEDIWEPGPVELRNSGSWIPIKARLQGSSVWTTLWPKIADSFLLILDYPSLDLLEKSGPSPTVRMIDRASIRQAVMVISAKKEQKLMWQWHILAEASWLKGSKASSLSITFICVYTTL